MATFNGTTGNDNFGGSSANDLFSYGNVTYSGGTIVAGRGNDTIHGGGGYDVLRFANLDFDYFSADRVGNDLVVGFRSTPNADGEPDPALGGMTVTNFYAADGSGLMDRVEFRDAYANCSIVGGVFNARLYTTAGVLFRTVAEGSAGNDSIVGSAVSDNLGGLAGNDTLAGLAGDDELDGDAGNDLLIGGTGNDDLYGGSGNDRLIGGAGKDTLSGGDGTDTVDYGSATGAVAVNLGQFSGKDLGSGTGVGSDTIYYVEHVAGSAHNDSLVGGGAFAVTLLGGAGNDTLVGGAVGDSLAGGAGADFFNASASGSTIGGLGNDTMDGGTVLDRVNYLDVNTVSYASSNGSVNVNLQTGFANDGVAGTDTLRNINFVIGSAFNDRLTGSNGPGFERFWGNGGDDTIDGGALTDTLNGTTNARAAFDQLAASVIVDLRAGTAIGQGNDVLRNINQVAGSVFADTIRGSDRTDLTEAISGAGGNDVLDGRGGNDFVLYQYAANGVSVNLATGIGFVSATDHDTISHFEGIRGSNYNDTLTGGNATNTAVEFFRGMGGNDTIDGGAGYDRVEYVDSVQGVVVRLGGTGAGTALDGQAVLGGQIVAAGTPGATIGTDTLRHIEAVRGSDFNDTLTGSAIASEEAFEGRKGNDLIDGGGGLDRAGYFQATSGVTVTLGLAGAAGTAADGYGTTDTLRNIENVQGSRDFADRMTGNELANVLDGQGGNDSLTGGAGNDTLLGGAGNDVLTGGSGSDSLVGGHGSDLYVVNGAGDRVNETGTVSSTADQVRSSVSWSLSASGNTAVERLTLSGSGAINGSGNALANTIIGNSGANMLNGAAGNDSLTGGAGHDLFRFTSALNGSTNVDRITDFIAADDTFQLDHAAFLGIGAAGALTAGAFRAGTAAGDASDRVIYDSATGHLYYDADGSGAVAKVMFATVAVDTALSHVDFVIV